MNNQKFVGMQVKDLITHDIGTIEYIRDKIAAVDYHDDISHRFLHSGNADVVI